MRVIAGKARRTNLLTLPGLNTRPTTDRIKETLFNMINPYINDCYFIDLFSGSGAIGIEALSRGAKACVFSENDKKAIQCIKRNLEAAKLSEDAEVFPLDAVSVLRMLEDRGQVYDIIYMDPPYNLLHEKKVLEYLSKSKLINTDSMIIIEASLDTKFDYIEDFNFNIYKRKEYKSNQHIFIELTGRVQ